MDHLLGTTFGDRYRLEQLVAVGGFGAVFRATHLPTGCDVAIKVLHEDLAEDAAIRERFRREAAMVERLRAPNTVATYELGADRGRLFLAMEWLRGESLGDRLAREGRLPWRQAVAIARAVCAALSEAHGLGIVHRDLKPANIHLETWSDSGFVKLLDFGIAKVIDPDAHDEELTQIGEVLGTLEYMAPEQLVGSTVDGRTDIYALGVVLYELVTGTRPFESATDATSLIHAMLSRRPRRPSRTPTREPIPAAFDELVLRCLAPRRRDRFPSIDALAAALDALEVEPVGDGSPTLVSPPIAETRTTQVIALPPMPRSDAMPTLPGRAARGSVVAMPAFERAMVVPCAPRSIPEPLAPAQPITSTARTTVPRTNWGVVTIAAVAALVVAFGGALAML